MILLQFFVVFGCRRHMTSLFAIQDQFVQAVCPFPLEIIDTTVWHHKISLKAETFYQRLEDAYIELP